MCGRFTITHASAELLAADLGVDAAAFEGYSPRFNLAPTDPHFIVRMKGEVREAVPAKWGLVNAWAKDNKGAARQINARAETLDRTPAFRSAFEKRRCVVPADGFYEWSGDRAHRQPYYFTDPAGGPLLFAGLYESWQPRPGEWERTFTIVTTSANDVMAPYHDRMPVILGDRDADLWMFSTTPPAQLKALLRPAPGEALRVFAVSARVNSVKNDDPSLVEPIQAPLPLL